MKTTLIDTRWMSDEELMETYGYRLEETDVIEMMEANGSGERDKIDLLRDLRDNDVEWLFEDLRIELDIKGDFLMIADLGLWDGRRIGYKEIDNLLDITYGDFYDLVIETNAYDLVLSQHHHDGTNYIRVREFKDDISDTVRDNFLDKLYYGTVTSSDISRVTKSVKNLALESIGAI